MTLPAPSRSCRATLPVAALALAALAGGAVAETAVPRVENGARFGAWTVACEAVAVNETICVLTQRLVEAEGQGFLTELLAFNDAELPQAWVVARVPLGVHFPGGFGLRPEAGEAAEAAEAGEAALAFEWQSCAPQLCEALLAVDAAALARLERAEGAIAGYVPAPGADPLLFRVATEGLGAGLAALAVALGQPGVAAAEGASE